MSRLTLPPATPAELLTPAEMARADRLAGGAEPLMEAAGRAVARAIQARWRPRRVLVLAGPGNNGGDGYVAARHLERAGWGVAVAPVGDSRLPAAQRWRGLMVEPSAVVVARAGLVVDAVFGAGLARPLEPATEALLRAVRAPMVAVDVPSGVDGATGAVRGFAPQAALTVTFFRLKPGHLLLPGRDLCGEIHLADIGLPCRVLEAIAPRTFLNGPVLWRIPRPGSGSHKHGRGHVTIVSSAAMSGAALLAALAARRAGAGLVTLACDAAAAAQAHRIAEPGALVIEGPLPDIILADARRRCVLVGPGLPPDGATRALVAGLLEAGRQLVLDAGALTAFAGAPEGLRGAALLTPHAAEFARLFGPVGDDKVAAARAAARQTGAVVLLKGSDTAIAAPDGRCAINANAPATLATGGSGDVLAGIAAAFLAQGMPAFEAACAAAWVQGDAACRAGPGLIAEDLPPRIGHAIAATFRDVSALG